MQCDGWFAYPAWLGYWPAVIGFFAIAWFELVDLAPDDPTRLAQAVLIYSGITFLGMLLFGGEAWLSELSTDQLRDLVTLDNGAYG